MSKEKKIDLIILIISVLLVACTNILFSVFEVIGIEKTFWKLLFVKYCLAPLMYIFSGFSIASMFVYTYLGKDDKINKRLGIFLLCVAILLVLLKLEIVIAYITGNTYLGANIEELIFTNTIPHTIWYYLLDHSWWLIFSGIFISLETHLSNKVNNTSLK